MKNKKITCGTILLLFAISGICNVTNVSAEEFELPPLSYYASGLDLERNDKLEINIVSSGTVNVYIMDYVDYAVMVSSGGLIWDYIKRWQDITYLEYTFTLDVYADGLYYVVIYNKNVLFGRTVEVNIRRIPYFDIIPVIAILMFLTGAIIGSVVIVISVKKHKKKKREAEPQYQEVIKSKSFYCSNCGAENIDITSDYCSNCGSKIKR